MQVRNWLWNDIIYYGNKILFQFPFTLKEVNVSKLNPTIFPLPGSLVRQLSSVFYCAFSHGHEVIPLSCAYKALYHSSHQNALISLGMVIKAT